MLPEKNALQSYPHQPNLIDAPDLPTLVNGFEIMLWIYLLSTPSIHEFFLGSILMDSILMAEHFLESIWRGAYLTKSIIWGPSDVFLMTRYIQTNTKRLGS